MSNFCRNVFRKLVQSRGPIPSVHLPVHNVQVMQSRALASGNHINSFTKEKAVQSFAAKHANKIFSMSVSSRSGPRRCCHSNRDQNDDRKPAVKGIVFVLPNPFDWLRNIWHMWNIRQVDPGFNLDDFMHGALQAVTLVTQYLSHKDFDSLKGLLTNDVIAELKETLHYDEGRRMSDMSIEETDIVYKKAKTWKLVEEADGIKLYVDTYFVAMKYDAEIGACMMEIGFGFRRGYHEGGPSEWIIDDVTRFQVREFHDGKPQ